MNQLIRPTDNNTTTTTTTTTNNNDNSNKNNDDSNIITTTAYYPSIKFFAVPVKVKHFASFPVRAFGMV